MKTLQKRIDQGEVIILDGAMGTELEKRGVPMDSTAWSGAALATHPDTIREVHEDYIRAGADIIITNSCSLFSIFMYGRGITNGNEIFNHFSLNAFNLLRSLDAEIIYQREIAPYLQNIQFAKAENRKVIGSMTDIIYY